MKSKIISLIFGIVLATGCGMALVAPAYATAPVDTRKPITDPALNFNDKNACKDMNNCPLISKYVNPLIAFLSAVLGIMVVISIIIAGIQYSGAGSDPQKVASARKRIRNSLLVFVGYLFLSAFLQYVTPGGLF